MVRPTGWLKVVLIAILLVMVAMAGLGIYLHDKPRFEVFAGITGTKFITGKEIPFEPYMIYRGWLPLNLTSSAPLFNAQVYDEEGRLILLSHPITLDILLIHRLWPFLPYKAPLQRNPPLDPRNPPSAFTLDEPGRYKVVVYASFKIGKRGEELRVQGEEEQRVYSEPVWIEVVDSP